MPEEVTVEGDPSVAEEVADIEVPDMGEDVMGGTDAGAESGESDSGTLEAGGSSESESGTSILKNLLNDQPDTPLEEIESPWNPELGGETRIYRGLQKLADVDGLPAIADIGIGLMEVKVDGIEGVNQEGTEEDAQQQQDEQQNDTSYDIEEQVV